MDRFIVNADLSSDLIPEAISFTFFAFVRFFFLIYLVTAVALKCVNFGYFDESVQKGLFFLWQILEISVIRINCPSENLVEDV